LNIEDNNLDEFIEDLLIGDFQEREAEVLRKIIVSREEKQLWKKTIEWTRQSKFFENLDHMMVMMQLDKKNGKTYYSSNNIPWWIHKHWASSEEYLNERLRTIRTQQSLMLNIYSAVITIGVFGMLVFGLNIIKDLFFGWHISLGILGVIITLIAIPLLLHYKTDLNEWIRQTFISRSLNNLDIESYIIAHIIAERKNDDALGSENKKEEQV